MAPANGSAAPVPQSTPSQPAPQQSYSQPAPQTAYSQPAPQAPPPQKDYPAQQSSDAYDNSYNDPALPPIEASDPPPPLPDYQQPECPGDNYIWTPGSWSYQTTGYYWVPGVWVMAPFVGALWTPPYWGYEGNRYRWHHGFWGDHIGFYGGINYGFGYGGRGYEGGYWNHNVFAYNRSVNNVNVSVVHNVYNHTVIENRGGERISYNGGRGGLNARPLPAELAAQREHPMPPVAAQIQHIRQAASNREQFASVNHGRPPVMAAAKPLATLYREPAAQRPLVQNRASENRAS